MLPGKRGVGLGVYCGRCVVCIGLKAANKLLNCWQLLSEAAMRQPELGKYAFQPVRGGANKVTDYIVRKWMSMVVIWLGYGGGPKREGKKKRWTCVTAR